MNPCTDFYPADSSFFRRSRLTALSVAASIVLAACGSPPAPSAPSLPAGEATQADACIPSEQGGCLPVAPASDRVDLASPTFSDPTAVTNPLHPSSDLHSAVMLGRSDGQPFRTEITLLPGTKTIEWNGQRIEALESQYVAFVDGRIHEVALDWYAQADDGSVWYLGEDVFNYEDGVVADTGGTWMAGRDGPGAMIMPADPQVGNVYRPENIPGVVFEEVTVQDTGMTVDGPKGPLTGAIQVEELHMDGLLEGKIFAPGYGEFSTGAGDNLEALALGVPTDSLSGPVPPELRDMFQAAVAIDDAVQAQDWTAAAEYQTNLNQAWESYRSGGTPPMLEEQMRQALDDLAVAIGDADPTGTRQGALQAALAGLDFQLRYAPPAEVDLARFGLWLRQLHLDLASGMSGDVAGDVATLEWIRGRLVEVLTVPHAAELDTALEQLRAAVDSEDPDAADAARERLSDQVSRLGTVG